MLLLAVGDGAADSPSENDIPPPLSGPEGQGIASREYTSYLEHSDPGWFAIYEICNSAESPIGFSWIEPSFAVSRFTEGRGIATDTCATHRRGPYSVEPIATPDTTLKFNPDQLFVGAYLPCPLVKECTSEESRLRLQVEQAEQIRVEAIMPDTSTGTPIPYELSITYRRNQEITLISSNWGIGAGAVVVVFPEVNFQELPSTEFDVLPVGEIINLENQAVQDILGEIDPESAAVRLADVPEGGQGDAALSFQAGDLFFERNAFVISDQLGEPLIVLNGERL
jgi:hypothetical protein